MKMYKKVISNIFNVLLLVVLIIIVFSKVQSVKNPNKVPSVLGLSNMTVLTGSMMPAIAPGDMIFVNQNAKTYEEGDIITYKKGEILVTHRIKSIVNEGQNIRYVCQGDANNMEDLLPVDKNQVVGRYIVRIPKGGYMMKAIKSPIGLGTIVILLFVYAFINLNVHKKSEKSLPSD